MSASGSAWASVSASASASVWASGSASASGVGLGVCDGVGRRRLDGRRRGRRRGRRTARRWATGPRSRRAAASASAGGSGTAAPRGQPARSAGSIPACSSFAFASRAAAPIDRGLDPRRRRRSSRGPASWVSRSARAAVTAAATWVRSSLPPDGRTARAFSSLPRAASSWSIARQRVVVGLARRIGDLGGVQAGDDLEGPVDLGQRVVRGADLRVGGARDGPSLVGAASGKEQGRDERGAGRRSGGPSADRSRGADTGMSGAATG